MRENGTTSRDSEDFFPCSTQIGTLQKVDERTRTRTDADDAAPRLVMLYTSTHVGSIPQGDRRANGQEVDAAMLKGTRCLR